jgi:3-hydroxyisobutyrate dehydrogenase
VSTPAGSTGTDRLLRVGFVGLGDQGGPMAERVIQAGWRLHVFARRPDVLRRFEERGAIPVASLRELAERSDVVHIMVVTDEQVREVVLGDNLLAGMRPGGILIVHSTVHPDTCRDLATVAAVRNVYLLDAAVSGGARKAAVGELTVMVGGDKEAFSIAAPVLSSFATTVRWMGDVGAGQATKLINNCMYIAHHATAHDADVLIRRFGLDLHAAHEVLSTSSGSSWVFGRLAGQGGPPRHHPKGDAFALQTVTKDVSHFRSYARSMGVTDTISDQIVDKVLALARSGDVRFIG